jgi:hypothetical protein
MTSLVSVTYTINIKLMVPSLAANAKANVSALKNNLKID